MQSAPDRDRAAVSSRVAVSSAVLVCGDDSRRLTWNTSADSRATASSGSSSESTPAKIISVATNSSPELISQATRPCINQQGACSKQARHPLLCSGHQNALEESASPHHAPADWLPSRMLCCHLRLGSTTSSSRDVDQQPEDGCICRMMTGTKLHAWARSTATHLELDHILRGDVLQLPEHSYALVEVWHLGQAGIAHLQP